MNFTPPPTGSSDHHFNVTGVTGKDWWAYVFLPRRWFVQRIAHHCRSLGRDSFTLPDGSTWNVNAVLEGKK